MRHLLKSAKCVIGRARSFRGNHRRTERSLRSAFTAESRALVRFLFALQDGTGNTKRRFIRVNLPYTESLLCILVAIFRPQPKPASRYGSDSPLVHVANFKHFVQYFRCKRISLTAYR